MLEEEKEKEEEEDEEEKDEEEEDKEEAEEEKDEEEEKEEQTGRGRRAARFKEESQAINVRCLIVYCLNILSESYIFRKFFFQSRI